MENQPAIHPGPTAAAGPWKWFQPRILMPLGLAALIVLVTAVHFLGVLFSAPKETPQQKAERKAAQQYEQTAPPSPADVAGFTKQTARAATDIGKETTNASNLAKLMQQGFNANGTPGPANPLAVPGNPLNTDPAIYKAWADADATARQAGLPGPGAAYGQPAPSGAPGTANNANSGIDERKEAARKREQQRLAASSIAIDFTKQVSEKPEPMMPTAQAEPAGPLNPPSLANAATEEPKVLKAHTCIDLCEGDLIETVLTNRIDGSQSGFADVMVTQPVFSHDWDPQGRRLLIPVGSRVLGNVTAVNSTQQQRLFVAFHKLRRPDGSTFSLDNFTGLDMAGASGLRDLVNNHYLRIFGVAGAIAAIGAVAQIGNSTNVFSYDPGTAMRNGISQQLGQQSMQILNRFLNQPPTMTVREGKNLVKVYIASDLSVPEYQTTKELAYAAK